MVSTAAGVQLQRAALPKQACTREVLAWLAGQASSSRGGSRSRGDGDAGSGNATCRSSGGGSGGGGGRGPAGCSPLQRLELASCAALAEADILALAACCPLLKSLQLGAAAAAAGSRLCAALAEHTRLLTRLAIGGASLADADLAALLHGLPALQHLDLSGCPSLTGSAFRQQLAEAEAQRAAAAQGVAGPGSGSRGAGRAGDGGCFLLRTLRLEACPGVDDAGAAAAAACCPHLETLSFRQCARVTAAAAAAALASCRNLRQLLLGGTGVAECSALPASRLAPGASALTLVELPVRAGRWVPAWQQLLGCRGAPKLLLRD